MKSLRQWLDEYAEHHTNPVNKKIHLVCIPLIFIGIIGLLTSIPHYFLDVLFPIDMRRFTHFGSLAVVAGLAYYLNLSIRLFVGMLIKSMIALWFVYQIEYNENIQLWVISLIIFTIGWAGQFYGHKIEGKKPSFFKDIQFLLIGPAWVICYFYKKIGVKC